MDKIDQNILAGTFSNLHITNKKSNIASIVQEMDKEEKYSIKLITSSPKNEYIKNRIRKKLRSNRKSVTFEEYLLVKKKSFPLITSRKSPNKILSSKFPFFDNNNINSIDNDSNKNNNKHYLLDKRILKIDRSLSEKTEKKNFTVDIKDKKEKMFDEIPLNKNKKISNLLKFKKNTQIKTLDVNMFNIKSKKINNFITETNNKKNKDKYYKTAKLFTEAKLIPHKNKTIDNNKRKSSLLSKTKTLNFVKSLPRLKISEAHLSDIENKLNKVYEQNKYDFQEKDKEIEEFKKKYQTIYEKNEKLFSYDIARISEEINKQLLSLKFQDFFSYLLTILKNYDKRIIDWKFTAEKEKNECPKELRFKNVKKKHKYFMEKLNKQYDWGKKVNKFMDELILNSKKKSMMYIHEKNENNSNEFINKKMNKDILVDKTLEDNEIDQDNNNINGI